MATVQDRHRGHNIPSGTMTTFNEIEYDREGGMFLNRTRLVLLAVIVLLLVAFSTFVGRYTAQLQFQKKAAEPNAGKIQISFLAVEPEKYIVVFEPNLYHQNGTILDRDVIYYGQIEAIFRPKIDTSVISLHFGLLNISGEPLLKRRLSIETPTDQVLRDVVKYELDTKINTYQETLTVTTRVLLRSSHYYSLFVNFTGNIGQIPEKGGFFKAVFYEEDKQSWYVATKLAPQGARNLLPCVDGKTHKASFEVSVIRRNGTSVIFNTKLRTTEPYNDSLMIDRFEKTELVRPDSLGLFMSNFKPQSLNSSNFVEIMVWTHKTSETFTLLNDVLPNTLVFIEEYLETAFPTKKLDIVIVPRDEIGSAESPGLIVINDKILENDNIMSIAQFQEIAETLIEHTIRQWLMPMRVVDQSRTEEKWLFDAISNFLRIVNTDHILPGWNLEARFLLDHIQPVMFYDSFTNSKPLSELGYRSDKFNYFSSHKGTSILRMLNYTFTEEIFIQTLKEYIHTEIYKYNDAVSFWKLLDDNARLIPTKIPKNLNVFQIVNSWIRNKNYPLVTLEIQGDDIILKQFRFNYNETVPTDEWIIPVILTSGVAYDITVWMENSKEVRVPGYNLASNGSWILANQYQIGYYRVIYRGNLLERISVEIKTGDKFDSYTVGQVLGDILEGALVGATKFQEAMDFFGMLIDNAGPYYGHWNPIFNIFYKLEMVLKNTYYYNVFMNYMGRIAGKAYKLFDNTIMDQADHIFGKIEMLCFAGRAELNEFVLDVKDKFYQWMKSNDTNPFNPTYRKASYCTIMQYATKEEHVFLLNKYLECQWTPDRKILAKSFSCSRNTRFLTLVLTFENIHSEDLSDIWLSIIDNPTAGPFMFYYIRNNWEKLYRLYADFNINLLSTMLHAAIRGLNTAADLEILRIFTEKHFSDTAGEKQHPALLEILYLEEEILRQKLRWREKFMRTIGEWILPHYINFFNNKTSSKGQQNAKIVNPPEADSHSGTNDTSTVAENATVPAYHLNGHSPLTPEENSSVGGPKSD